MVENDVRLVTLDGSDFNKGAGALKTILYLSSGWGIVHKNVGNLWYLFYLCSWNPISYKHKKISLWRLPRTTLQHYFVLLMNFTKFLMLKFCNKKTKSKQVKTKQLKET